MNRRDFLYAGTAAAAAVTTRGMNASAYAAIPGANERVGLGVIGLGRRSTEVCWAFAQNPQVEFRALCDIYDKQVNAFQGRLKEHVAQAPVSVEYQKLLDRKDVDAVYIATPDHLHVTIAKAALEADKDVYLEKPTLHHWDERSALLDAEKKSKRIVQCGMQQRSGSHYFRAKQEIFAERKLGNVVFARAVWHNFSWQRRNIAPEPKPAGLDWDLFLGPAPKVPYQTIRYTAWRYFPDYGNGLLADIMTHWVDVAQWMLDDAQPTNAAALGGIYQLHDGRQNPDTVSAIVQYDTWNLNFESSVLSIRNNHPSVFFEGTQGTLDMGRDGYTFTPNEGEPVRVKSTESLERAHTRNFLDAVILGSKVNAPVKTGIEASVPVQMALRSYWSHKIVSRNELV